MTPAAGGPHPHRASRSHDRRVRLAAAAAAEVEARFGAARLVAETAALYRSLAR